MLEVGLPNGREGREARGRGGYQSLQWQRAVVLGSSVG